MSLAKDPRGPKAMAKTKTKASFFIFECHRATVLVSSSLLTRDRSSCYHCANNSTDKEQRSKNWKETKSWKSNKNTRVIKTGITAKQANPLRPEQINSNLMWRCQLFRCKQAAFFILHRTSQRGYILMLFYLIVWRCPKVREWFNSLFMIRWPWFECWH